MSRHILSCGCEAPREDPWDKDYCWWYWDDGYCSRTVYEDGSTDPMGAWCYASLCDDCAKRRGAQREEPQSLEAPDGDV